MEFDALILDLDGTLWDATHATAQDRNSGLEEAGLAFLFAAWGFGEPQGECAAFSSFAELAAGLLPAT